MLAQLQRFIGHIRTVGGIWWRVMRLGFSVSARPLLCLLFLMVLIGLLPALEVQITRDLVQAVQLAIVGHGQSGLIWSAISFGLLQGGLTIVSITLNAGQEYGNRVLHLQLINRVSALVMEKAVVLDLQHFEDDKLYDQLQRARQESTYRPYQVITQLFTVVSQCLSVLSVAVVLLSWNVWVGLLILLSPLPSLCAQVFFAQKQYQIERERMKDLRGLQYLQQLVTTAASVKEVRLFRLGSLFLTRYREGFEAFLHTDLGIARTRSVITTPLSILTSCISSGAQIYAIFFAIYSGNMGLLAGYLQAITLVQGSIVGLLTSLSQVYESNLFLSNLFEFLDVPSLLPCSGKRPFPTVLRTGIEFRHVSFHYPGTERVILQDISFRCGPGECIALVGRNGAGKTTIVKLLTRLYEPTEGQILIDDLPIAEYDLNDLRKHIGTIFQDFVQYELAVSDNIGFGNLEERAKGESIQQAARASKAAAFIEGLPLRYDTRLGRMFEKGEQLSIGQWQKIALARAFMSQASLVVLDEPTASIDAEAEAEIFCQLREVAKGATALLIAHRFSTVRMADRILVLEQGRISEEGTHEGLMREQGLYAHLFSLQAAGYTMAS